VTDNVFPNVPRVIVGCFHGWYLSGAFCHHYLFDGMLEHRAHGVSRGTEYEEHGRKREQDRQRLGRGGSCRGEEEIQDREVDEWIQYAEEVVEAKPRKVELCAFIWDYHGEDDEEEEEGRR